MSFWSHSTIIYILGTKSKRRFRCFCIALQYDVPSVWFYCWHDRPPPWPAQPSTRQTKRRRPNTRRGRQGPKGPRRTAQGRFNSPPSRGGGSGRGPAGSSPGVEAAAGKQNTDRRVGIRSRAGRPGRSGLDSAFSTREQANTRILSSALQPRHGPATARVPRCPPACLVVLLPERLPGYFV